MITTTEPTLGPFSVGGRQYQPVVPRIFGQVMYLTRQLRAVGVPDQADAGTVMDLLLEHGRLPNLIAASYTPSGEEWTKESADTLANALYRLTDPQDIATLTRVAEDALLDFFGVSRIGAAISPAASLIAALRQMARTAEISTSAATGH